MSEIHASAEFSLCGEHRHVLSRWWSDEPRALVCGCNPSSAGAERNDPTVCRLIALLRDRPGIGGFDLVNWEDRIGTDPDDMRAWRGRLLLTDFQRHRVGMDVNLARIRALALIAAVRIVAWGNLVPAERQTSLVLRAMSLDGAYPLHAFALTQAGKPLHPLARGRERIALGRPLIVWRAAAAEAA